MRKCKKTNEHYHVDLLAQNTLFGAKTTTCIGYYSYWSFGHNRLIYANKPAVCRICFTFAPCQQ